MHFDPTVSLGTVLMFCGQVVAVVSVWSAFKAKVDALLQSQAALLDSLNGRLEDHEKTDDARFSRLETRIIDLVAGLQRLIGRDEVFRRHDRSLRS